jgi:hypothetical protein
MEVIAKAYPALWPAQAGHPVLRDGAVETLRLFTGGGDYWIVRLRGR